MFVIEQPQHLIYLLFIVKVSLPPVNEVWGKVIFSEACVKNSVHGGGMRGSGGCVWQGMHGCWGGPRQPCTPLATMHTPQQPHMPPSNHACPLQPCMPPRTTHAPQQPHMPTSNHACPNNHTHTPATMHALGNHAHPPANHACPPANHACPPWTDRHL